MAFGQGETLVTPLQEAVAYGTFAADGTRYAPQVVNSIVSPTGKVVKQFEPRVTGHVSLPASTYDQILTGLEGAIYDTQRDGLRYVPGLQRDAARGKDRYRHRELQFQRAAHGLVRRLRADAAFHAPLCRRRRDRPGGLRRGGGGTCRPRHLHLSELAHPSATVNLRPPANAP